MANRCHLRAVHGHRVDIGQCAPRYSNSIGEARPRAAEPGLSRAVLSIRCAHSRVRAASLPWTRASNAINKSEITTCGRKHQRPPASRA
jgi:hypothetical protein